MTNKPKIGILSLYDTKKESKWNSYWMFPGYVEGVIEAGGMPFIIPLLKNREDIEDLVEEFDGFLFTGGQDVSPCLYKRPMYTYCGEVSPERDTMESILLQAVCQADKALLGICRGLQIINVVFGGSLYQDLEKEMPRKKFAAIQHSQKTEFVHPVHRVIFEKNSILYRIFGEEGMVNSMHHQGICEIAPDIKATARAEDGLVEGIEIPDMRFGVAVQWHPEFLWSRRREERELFQTFIQAAAGIYIKE